MMLQIISKMIFLVKLFNKNLAKKIFNLLFKEDFFYVDQVYDQQSKKILRRLVVELPGKGCAWYKSSGGCTMCGFNQKLDEVNKKYKFSFSDSFWLYKIAENLNQKIDIVYIYNGGSFLNQEEISIETQLRICHSIKKHMTIFSLLVESRPEFINKESVIALKNAIGKKKILKIGIGLESVSKKIREVNIHKGFTTEIYEKKVKLLNNLDIKVLVYVFLKPIGLSEKEAIEETVKTIKYSFENNANEIALSCAFIQEGTEMDKLYKNNQFRPPWLWSIIEVLKNTAHLGLINVGSFRDNPMPIATPANCGKCDAKIIIALEQFNFTKELEVFSGIDCECKKQWEKEL